MDVFKDIDLAELPAEQRALAELIGVTAYTKLVKKYGGLSIYIPKQDGFIRSARNAEIRRKFDGHNYRQLAMDYDLTEVMVRGIVAEIDQVMRTSQIDGQESLL